MILMLCKFSVKILFIQAPVRKNVDVNNFEVVSPWKVVGVVFHSGGNYNAVITVGKTV